jgi:hypothetical protein
LLYLTLRPNGIVRVAGDAMTGADIQDAALTAANAVANRDRHARRSVDLPPFMPDR